VGGKLRRSLFQSSARIATVAKLSAKRRMKVKGAYQQRDV
jgi:hypothetical protein